MKKKTVEEGVEIVLVYLGRILDFKNSACFRYAVFDKGQRRDVTFGVRLQKYHYIGGAYKAKMKPGGVFTTSSTGIPISDFHSGISKKEIAECVVQDERCNAYLKSRKEQSSLNKKSREAVEKLVPLYRRASQHEKISMIRAIVETLEEQ